MTGVDPRQPCIVGVAQRTWHPGTAHVPEPLAMQAEVVRAAAADAGARGGSQALLDAVGSMSIVNCLSWAYDDPVGRLSAELAISPAHRHYSGMSGTTPQVLVDAAARRMLAGELDVAVVVGAEALHTRRERKKMGEKIAWSYPAAERPLDPSLVFLPSELTHEVFQAWLTFAVRDVARRATRGDDPVAYRRSIGELLAPMTEVAAGNPNAWIGRRHTAEEIVHPTPSNRMVGYPYTKLSISVMDVDMAAGVVVATHEAADRLGVPAERRVYLRAFAEANDAVHLAQHLDLARSPAMEHTFGTVLRAVGVGVDEIAHVDLYSCFASSLFFALDALGTDAPGLAASGRSVTVTGGLPFSGGAASNYLSHALTAMTGVLRDDPGSLGLVSGVGMHMTKHVAALYSTEPGELALPDDPPEPETLPVVDTHDGAATVAAYSVVHGRGGEAQWALLVTDTADGARCYARIEDSDVLGEMEAEEWVGREVTLTPDAAGVNRVS